MASQAPQRCGAFFHYSLVGSEWSSRSKARGRRLEVGLRGCLENRVDLRLEDGLGRLTFLDLRFQ
jgi:hypothetical protein